MKENTCDILIVGAGPAGLSSAMELLQGNIGRVMILDKGESIHQRHCPALTSGCCSNCPECSILSGVGGASGMLGGKLCFFPAGERLAKHVGFSSIDANSLILPFLEQIAFGIPNRFLDVDSRRGSKNIINSLTLKDYAAIPVLQNDMRQLFINLMNSVRIGGGNLQTNAEVIDISPGRRNNRFKVTYMHRFERKIIFVGHSIILATGRSGAKWIGHLLSNLGIAKKPDTVDMGVRLEIPTKQVITLLPHLQDPKLKIYEGTANEVRTLCWCRGGQLTITKADDFPLVDGHFGTSMNPNTSVSIVSRQFVPNGFSPLEFALSQFNKVGNLKRPVFQELSAFLGLRSSKMVGYNDTLIPKIPFYCQELDIKSLIDASLLERLREMFYEINLIVGGNLANLRNSRIYAPVIDKYWETPVLDKNLMTRIHGLYILGDATGLGRGILQGIFSGIIAARSIINQHGLGYQSRTFQKLQARAA